MDLDDLMLRIGENIELLPPPHPEERASGMIRVGYLSGILEHHPLPQPRDEMRSSLFTQRQYITVSIGFLAEGSLYSALKDGLIQQIAKEIRDELKRKGDLTIQLFMEQFIQTVQEKSTEPAVETLIFAARKAEGRYGMPHPFGLGFAAIQFFGEQLLLELSMEGMVMP